MFGEECTLPMDVGLSRREPDLADPISSHYAVCVRDALKVAYDQVRRHSGQAVLWLYDRRAVRRLFAVDDWVMRYYHPAKKCKLDSLDWSVSCCVRDRLDIQRLPDSPIVLVQSSGCEESSPACGSDVVD